LIVQSNSQTQLFSFSSDKTLPRLRIGRLIKQKKNTVAGGSRLSRFPVQGRAAHCGHGLREKIPGCRTPLPGVFPANFSQVFPEDRGTNFAVREGEKVAEMVRRAATGF
jgi:hypothetical protein